MRSLRNIEVPERFGVYVVLGSFGVWAVRIDLLLWVYAIAVVALVAWLWWNGKKESRS